MKKIIKKIYKFFSKLINNFIVTPISKLIYLISDKTSKPTKQIENWLSKTNTLLFVSLFVALIIFVTIDQKIWAYSENSAEVIPAQKVNVLFDEDNYVVEGVPQNVDITLIGNTVDLYIARQSPTNELTIDLWGLKPGTHKVDIKYNQINNGIKYSVNPSTATVLIYEKVSSSRSLTVDLLNQDMLDPKYIIKKSSTNIDSVSIKGASYKVDKVATVKALVDVKSLPKYELGESIKISAPLKAYDEAGNIVDVEISPNKVDVELLIDSPSKEVPIQVIPQGQVVFNKGISSLIINNNNRTKVVLYGPEDVLSTIDYLPVTIDVTNLSDDTQFKVKLDKPLGIKYMDLSNVTIDVKLSNDIKNKDIDNFSISWKNLGNNYKVSPIDVDSITVKLKGISDVIDNIKNDDISVYVDLNGLGPGIHEVPVIVKGNDPRIEYGTSMLKIKVKIYQK